MPGNPEGAPAPEAAMEKLRAIARARDLTFYGVIAPLLGIETGNEYFGVQVGRVLDAINRHEFADNRPLISSVVVSKDSMQPGHGYYECARDLKRYSSKDDLEIWIEELNLVYDYWSRH